ncbi:type IV toxin-antitoxin system AbiEi family antitoxin domain-containing protein [Aerococcaceae bacterium zg-ZJ1578]|nr:type IV toxin-antitoxin system AbiEi family antitoxin domain-containing protein [Aerococcaceae bacterium zg-1578]
MQYDNRIQNILDSHLIIRSSDFTEAGIPTIYLSRLVSKGHLKKVV